MSLLNTKNPHAIQSLMTETVFDIGFTEPMEPDESLPVDNAEISNSDSAIQQHEVKALNQAELDQNAVANDQKEPKSVPHLDDPVPHLKLYGDNNRNILFIVDTPGEQFFSREAELAFLKTLAAMKLALDDVAVINLASFDQQIEFDFIQKELAPSYWVFLGANPSTIHLGEYPENIWSKKDDSQILRTYSFDEMLTDINKKKSFWNAVKLIDR